MRYDPWKHHRRSIRLAGYDYVQIGAYFVTIDSFRREYLFGDVVGNKMMLNSAGRIVEMCWYDIPFHFPDVTLDASIVMPNHIHGIVWIVGDGRGAAFGGGTAFGRGTACRAPTVERFGRPVPNSLPTVIRSFKSAATKQINQQRGARGLPVWQRNYYEHIVRNEIELTRIRNYIATNPLHWELDREEPHHKG